MELTCAMLAAYAELAADSRLSVIGGDLDTIRLRGDLPGASVLPLYLVVLLRLPKDECGREYTIQVEFRDPGGEVIEQLPQKVTPPEPPQADRMTKVGAVVAFQGLRFTAAGKHDFRVTVDGKEIASIPVHVEQISPPS
jgi:hypothetical protein